MAELHDPDKPAGFVVSVDEETGVATRNDGKLLQPANKNPWYVLMTIAGEPTGRGINNKIEAQNRRYWNGLACREVGGREREKIAKALNINPKELDPLSGEEKEFIANEFRNRFDLSHSDFERDLDEVVRAFQKSELEGGKWPDPTSNLDLYEFHFAHILNLRRRVFLGDLDFRGSTFSNIIRFSDSVFRGSVEFDGASFSKGANFMSVEINGDADFTNTNISGIANFRSSIISAHATFEKTNFYGAANFADATFHGSAEFSSTNFKNGATFARALFEDFADFERASFNDQVDFSDGGFAGTTDFSKVVFHAEVPLFYQRRFHQDTDLTTRNQNWPNITQQNAARSKRAYTRLRQVMNELHKPDAEHFFGRQEMRCDAYLNGPLFKALSKGYGAVSDYGYSIVRPAAWLVGLIAVFCGIFGSYLKHGKGVEGVAAIWQGLGLSIANTFPYLGFHGRYLSDPQFQEMNGWIEVLGGVQTVLGGVLLFFLLLGLRNRFRLK